MCKCRCLNANVCVLKANFISFMLDCSICIFIRYFTLLEVSPASRLVESPCDPFLRFHMHTHHRPAGLAEALLTGKEIVKESVVVFSMQFSCEGLHHSLPKTMLYSGAFLPSVNLEFLEIAIVAISKYPHFYPTLDRLHGIILLET